MEARRVELEVRPRVTPELTAQVRSVVDSATETMLAVAEQHGAVRGNVRWLLSDQFEADVDALNDGSFPPFTVDRVGGTVAGKTIQRGEGHVIVLNSEPLAEYAAADGLASLVFLIAHELAHVTQHLVRHAAGMAIVAQGGSLRERFGKMVRFAVDEWRADAAAFAYVGVTLSVRNEDTGESRPASVFDTFAVGHVDSLASAADEMYPRLPELVTRYRRYELSLDQLLADVGTFTDQILTLLAHWRRRSTLQK